MKRFRCAFVLSATLLIAGSACSGGGRVAPPVSDSGSDGQRAAGARSRARLSLDPATLTFTTPAVQTFTASLRLETTLKAVSSNVAVATVSPDVAEACKPDRRDSTRGGKRDGCGTDGARGESQVLGLGGRRGAPYSATFTVTPVASGGATITVTDDEGDTATVAVTVVGSKQKIYVANEGALPSGSVTVYDAGANGNVSPIATIAGPSTGLLRPYGIAVDDAGRIYVANNNNSVRVYAPGADGDVAPTATIAGAGYTFLDGPNGLALDNAGNIYVAETGTCCHIVGYRAGSKGDVAPFILIDGFNTLLNFPLGIAIDRAGRIYVTNQGVSGAGHGDGVVTIFAPGANGNVAPSAIIRHPVIPGDPTVDDNRGLSGVAVDAKGNIYVANFSTDDHLSRIVSTDNVSVYAPGSNGSSVAPIATIGGPSTGLSGPIGVAVDSAGKIYVANARVSSITVYAPGANGDVAPIATISGSNTGLAPPTFGTYRDGMFLTVR
jgi:hypothetical protein